MNLRLTIRSDKKYKSSGTGVFVKDSSGIRELQTIDEIKIHYPDFDLSNITQEYYSPYDVWSSEITHNLAYLASHIPAGLDNLNLYYLLWRPEDIGWNYLNPSNEYSMQIKEAIDYINNNTDKLLDYGSQDEIDDLLKFIKSLYDCISNLKVNYSDEFKIIAQR